MMGICIYLHIFKPVLPGNVVKEIKQNKKACKQHLDKHNKKIYSPFHYNLCFDACISLYLRKPAIGSIGNDLESALKTPKSHCSHPAFIFLLFILPYFKGG